MNRQYPLHILESRPNGTRSAWNAFTSQLQKSGQAALTAATPHVATGIESAIAAKATEIVNMIDNLIPGQKDMAAIGKRIASEIEKAINQNLLPQLYDRGTLSGALLSDAELQRIYNAAISKVPTSQRFDIALGQGITLNLRYIVQSALPFSKFMTMARKIEPLATTAKAKTLPVIENRVKDVALFTAMTGVIIGGVAVFGFMKLYDSAS